MNGTGSNELVIHVEYNPQPRDIWLIDKTWTVGSDNMG